MRSQTICNLLQNLEFGKCKIRQIKERINLFQFSFNIHHLDNHKTEGEPFMLPPLLIFGRKPAAAHFLAMNEITISAAGTK